MDELQAARESLDEEETKKNDDYYEILTIFKNCQVLSQRERNIMYLRNCKDKTYAELAGIMQETGAALRWCHKRSIAKFRAVLLIKLLDEYLKKFRKNKSFTVEKFVPGNRLLGEQMAWFRDDLKKEKEWLDKYATKMALQPISKELRKNSSIARNLKAHFVDRKLYSELADNDDDRLNIRKAIVRTVKRFEKKVNRKSRDSALPGKSV
jgi:isoleucyl-tRNA synthetase